MNIDRRDFLQAAGDTAVSMGIAAMPAAAAQAANAAFIYALKSAAL